MVQLIGRITKDGIVTELKERKKVLNFSIAINDYYKSKTGESVKMVTYINCAYWNNPEKFAVIIKKGKAIEVNGRLSVGAYINAGGEAVGTLNFHVSNFKIYGNGNTRDAEAAKENDKAKNKNKAAGKGQVKETADDLPF